MIDSNGGDTNAISLIDNARLDVARVDLGTSGRQLPGVFLHSNLKVDRKSLLQRSHHLNRAGRAEDVPGTALRANIAETNHLVGFSEQGEKQDQRET